MSILITTIVMWCVAIMMTVSIQTDALPGLSKNTMVCTTRSG